MAVDMSTAFLSYSREDSDFAGRLATDLKAAGASVWLDQLDIPKGQPWDRAIQDALTNCRCVLVVLSPAAVNSTNVMDEASFALDEKKTVIPVIYRDCSVPFRLRRLEYVDFRQEQDYAGGLKELFRALAPAFKDERQPERKKEYAESSAEKPVELSRRRGLRNWGAVMTAFYAIILVALVVPGAGFIGQISAGDSIFLPYHISLTWVLIGIVLASQALLLFLSVDTSWRRLKPRAHILVSCLVTGTLWALLTAVGILALGGGIYGDHPPDSVSESAVLACLAGIWVAWTIVFYLYFRNSNALITRATSWLLKGSVLELLIAVPCHVIVRRRHDCSAPAVTSFGIATGLAIMLLSFGPSVLLLYKKRLEEYPKRAAATGTKSS